MNHACLVAPLLCAFAAAASAQSLDSFVENESAPVMYNDPALTARVKAALMDAGKLAEARAAGRSLPGPHNALFQPVPEPTLRAGVTAMSFAAISLLQ